MARPALTQLKVDKLRPDPTRRLEVPDHLYPALRLVVQPSGARAFALRTKIAGRSVKLTLKDVGLDLKAARDATRELLAEIAKGNDPRARHARLNADTLAGAVELYLSAKAGETRPKTRAERQRHLRRDWAPLHARALALVGRREINARLAEIKESCGPIAANRSRASLHALFQWAMVDAELIEANPVAATRRPLKEEPKRARVLDLDECRKLWAATEGGGRYHAILRLLLLLGQRRSEVAGMRWRELDLARAQWSLPPERVKNGLPHIVPLPRQALEIIQAQPRGGEFVFGPAAPFGDWVHSKRRLDRRLGPDMPAWVLHDARRSFVTMLNEELRIPPHVVEACVNHVSGDAKKGVAGTYNRALYIAERTRALQSWADLLTGEQTDRVLAFPQAAAL
jgi:integrase